MRGPRITAFVALLLMTVCVAAGMAHVMAMPNKMAMGQSYYFVAQQVYRGWNTVGIAVLAALLTCALLAFQTRSTPVASGLAIGAVLCLLLSLIVFFVQTQPANAATLDWTHVPEDWQKWRNQWEWSHLIDTCLYLGAFVLVAFAMVTTGPEEPGGPLTSVPSPQGRTA